MYTTWTKHLPTPAEKEGFEKSIKSAKPVLDVLKTILKEQEDLIDRSESDIKVFDQPNWEFRQAFKNGQRSALRSLYTLVDLDHQKGIIQIDPKFTKWEQ